MNQPFTEKNFMATLPAFNGFRPLGFDEKIKPHHFLALRKSGEWHPPEKHLAIALYKGNPAAIYATAIGMSEPMKYDMFYPYEAIGGKLQPSIGNTNFKKPLPLP